MINESVYGASRGLHCRNKIILPLLLWSLSLSGSGLTTDAYAQEIANDIQGYISDDVPCEPLMSNVTIPVASEDVLPPEMYMVYSDGMYLGELSQSKYREGETVSDLDIIPENVSSDLPTETIEIKDGTCAQFKVRGTPSTLPPNTLDVSSYSTDGTPLGVLNATEDNTSTFRIDPPSGAYVLLSTATWIPSGENEYVTGYAIYKFLVNVT